MGEIATEIAAILDDTGTSGVVLTSSERDAIATALLDLSAGVEAGYTVRQTLRLIGAALAGKLSGCSGGTCVFRNMSDTQNAITSTVDGNGNRTAVTHNP